MDPIASTQQAAFPQQIREYFQKHSAETDNTELPNIFKNNDSVRKAFISWTDAHKTLVKNNDRLFQALTMADSSIKMEEQAQSVNDFYHSHQGDKALHAIDEILVNDNCLIESFPSNYATRSLELFESGIIDEDQLVKLFAKQRSITGEIILQKISSRELKAIIPNLKRLDPAFLVKILSLQSVEGSTWLHYAQPLEAFSLIETLETDLRVALLTIQDNEGSTILHCEYTFKQLIPSLLKLPRDDLVNVFSKSDNEGGTPLQFRNIFALFAPYIKTIKPRTLIEILSILGENGLPAIHDPENLKVALPYLAKLDPDYTFAICTIVDEGGNTLLHSQKLNEEGNPLPHGKELLEIVLPLLFNDDFSPSNFVTLCEIKNKEGIPPLHDAERLSLVIPFLEKLNPYPEDCLALLSIQDDTEGTLLHYEETCELLISFLKKQNHDVFSKAFSIQDDEGNTPLHYANIFELVTNNLAKQLYALFTNIVYIQNNEGQTPLHDPQIFPLAIPFLERARSLKIQQHLLSLQDNKGQIPLHNPAIFMEFYPWFNEWPILSLNQICAIQDNAGNTILHNSTVYNYTFPLFDKLAETLQIKNKAGYTAEEWQNIETSENWLVKDKKAVYAKPLSVEEYDEKAQQVKQNLDSLWNSFVFGDEEGNIPMIYLEVNVDDELTPYTPGEIKEQLDGMIDKIIGRTSWLGTPHEDDEEGLLVYYSQMLTNLERLLSLLEKEDSPAKMAGPLISIAKVELEGRCSSGYQSEIEQPLIILDTDSEEEEKVEEGGLEVKFNKLATSFLMECIENIARRDDEQNVHAFAQMLYSTGLAISPDPLSKMDIDDCHEQIIAEWTKEKIVSDLSEIYGRLNVEELQQWFELLTPEDFGRDFLVKQDKLELEERQIIRNTKGLLKEKGLKLAVIEDVVEIFQSTEGAGLRVISPSRQFVSEEVFKKLNSASSLQDVADAQRLMDQENNTDRSRRIELMDEEDRLKELEPLSENDKKLLADVIDKRKLLQLKSSKITSEFKDLKLAAETRIKLGELIMKKHPSLTREDLGKIVEQKKIFDDQVAALAEKMDVPFVARISGLPSKAIAYQRKQAYAAQFFSEEDEVTKLNQKGTVEILLHIGILKKEQH